MSFTLLLSALLMGLLGSSHCVVMCGGVVGMTCSALPLARRGKPLAQLPYVLGYNAGRVASYAAAGALAGALGTTLASLGLVQQAGLGLRLAAGLLMVGVGAYLAGFGRALRWLERAGEPLWRRIAPLARRLIPVRTPLHAIALGLLWGWMPCGLVYAALAAAVTSGSSLGGAATMAAFGAGTLPMLITMGSAAGFMVRLARAPRMRVAAALVVAAFGLVQIEHVGVAWARGEQTGTHACCAHAAPTVADR